MSNAYHVLANGDFSQNWNDPALITANDDWSNVPGIVGYRGDGLTGGTGVDPTTVRGNDATAIVDVNANQTNPATFTSGGVTEFQGTDGVVALQGSGTARAPYLVIHLDATGRQDLTFSTRLRDLEIGTGSPTADQPIAVQYRIGDAGEWINVPGGFVANANTGGDTMLSVSLPAAVNGQAKVQVRILTTDAPGSSGDNLIGIDDIAVTSLPLAANNGQLSIADASVAEGNAGETEISFTVTRDGGTDGAVSATWTASFPNNGKATDLAGPLTGTVEFAANQTVATVTLRLVGDTEFEADETFLVTLSDPAGGAKLGDAQATGTIVNDDAKPPIGGVFINEIHYDNAGTDAGEAIEIAAPAGTDLTGWSVVLYNGGTDGVNKNAATVYATRALSGTVVGQDDGFGTISISIPASPGLQNGPFDGIALVDAAGRVVQFLSYEGVITAKDGPAAGLTSTDVGVSEGGSTPTGFSLQLTGQGASYDDFTWVDARAASFGAVNAGQDFIGEAATGLVRIGDASVVEGDSGESLISFTVRRAGGLGQTASVDWLLNTTGSADTADFKAGQPLGGTVSFAPGVSAVTVTLTVTGDTVYEPNETFNLLLANPAGNIAIVDGTGVGTILNDDPVALRIFEIQGEAHRSPFEGQPVITGGIVTAVASNGFYLQDAAGDGNARTSDALFVFTGATPTAKIGDAVEVRGRVSEFLPGNTATNLTTTQVEATAVSVQSSGNALPAAALIGEGGLTPPTAIIEDDGFTSFDPTTDGLDFYESVEGMRVTVVAPVVVANTNGNGETYVLASGGAGATGFNDRGGVVISEGDYNPERIQLDANSLFPAYQPNHSQGDVLADVTGIISYGFGSYELLVTEAVTVTKDVSMGRETTGIDGDRNHLTVGNYNLENIDPTDAPAKFEILARDIVFNLSAPDILAVQEIQDADGRGNGSDLSGQATAAKLIAAIKAAGGPDYIYVEIAPDTPGSTGGEGGGNIRNGYFYNPDRVSLVEGSLALIQDPAYNGTRKPLVGTFDFNGENVTLINVHFTSRLGSEPLMGANQPANNEGDAARTAQAAAIAKYVQDRLATDPSLKLGVVGDFNGFPFEDASNTIEAVGLTNLHELNPLNERYTYIFDGNLQAIDNFLVTGGLMGPGTQFDIVHINAEQVQGTFRGTDHDPSVARFFIEAPNEAPTDLALDRTYVAGDAGAGALVGTVTASDVDGDILVYSLDEDAGGLFAIDPETGELRTTDAFGLDDRGAQTVVVRATDPDGLSATHEVTITVTDAVKAVVTGRRGPDGLSASASDQDGSHLDGGLGNDMLQGDRYDDRLIGGGGDDQLAGGGGADQFRFFGTQIDGGSDFDTITDLDFGTGDTLVFGSFGVGTFIKENGVGAFANGTSAILDSFADVVAAAGASDLITASRSGSDLILSVLDADGQVQTIGITGAWEQYVLAGGTDGL